MTSISGYWFAAGSSTRHAGELQLGGDSFALEIVGVTQQSGSLDSLKISDRLGNVSRKIYFSDNSLFETFENDKLDTSLSQSGLKSGKSFVHRMETSWRWIAVSLVLTIAIGVSFFKWGLPFASEKIARALPVSVHEVASAGALKFLDAAIFDPSELDDSAKQSVTQRFDVLLNSVEKQGFTFRLYFRKMSGIPNALALPSGEVIVTDELIQISDPLEELDSVLLHEIGHVLERHGMQQVIQASTLTLIASLAIGDVSGLNELATGIPIFLMQNNYSRASEHSADDFAFAQMSRLGMDPKHFASMITKLENFDSDVESKKEQDEGQTDISGQSDSFPEYLSTHPDSQKRAQRALEMSRLFNQSN